MFYLKLFYLLPKRKECLRYDLLKGIEMELTSKQVCEMLGISRSQLYIIRKKLRYTASKKNPNIVLYQKSSVEALIRSYEEAYQIKFIPQAKLEKLQLMTNKQSLGALGKVRKSRLAKLIEPKGVTLGNGGPQLVFAAKDVVKIPRLVKEIS
jgi:predicted DNA-binding transcriptional regulator AlpA